MVLRLNISLKLGRSIVSLHPHKTAQAQHQLLSLATVYTPPHGCRQQCRRRPLSIALYFHAEWSSPQATGDFNILNYTLLNSRKLHTRRIWLFASWPHALSLLSIVISMLTKIQSKTWTYFPTSNTLEPLPTRSLNHCQLSCRGRKHCPLPALHWASTLPSHGNAALGVVLRGTYKTIPTTRLRCVKSTNISVVGSRARAIKCTVRMCWRKKTPLRVSEASKEGIACRSLWQACQMIRLSWSGNYTLSRIWDGMSITNALSNTGVKTSSKAWHGRCGSEPTPTMLFTPCSIHSTAIRHQNASILKCTLETGGGRHR